MFAFALIGATVPFIALLVGRRLVLARRERRERELAARVRPRALLLVDGVEEAPGDERLGPDEAEALAGVLGRYSRLVAGESRRSIARFFESRGSVDSTAAQLEAVRAWRRARAAHLLGDMGSPWAVAPLTRALEDRNPEVRAAAAAALGRLGAVDGIDPLLEAVADERLPRTTAERTLLAIGEAALEPLAGHLADRDVALRRLAVELFARIGSPQHAGLLAEALEDPDCDVRAKAARGLGRIASGAEIEALRAALDDRVSSVRAGAAVGLAAVGDRTAVGALTRIAASDPAFATGRAAARAVAELDPAVLTDPEVAEASQHLREAADRQAAGLR